jgi:hypothetical protein
MRGDHHVEGRKGHAFGFARCTQIAVGSRDIVIPGQRVDPKKELPDPFALRLRSGVSNRASVKRPARWCQTRRV